MNAKKEPKKSCIYPCPGQCAEAARFIDNSSTISSIEEKGVEGYDLVYVADLQNKHMFMFGTAQQLHNRPRLDPAQPVHDAAHKKAAQGEVVNYEWSISEEPNTCFFQSTLIPLRDSQGQVGSILGLVKNITPWAYNYARPGVLKEMGGRTFSQVLLAVREEEKKQISAALHDEIGSAAVILTSLLSMVRQSVESNNKAQAEKDIAELDKQIKNSIERVKNIVVSLRPPNLEAVGLEDSIREMVENVAHYRGLKHTFTADVEAEGPVSDEVRIVLYRIAQESLNNIVKHAQAQRVDVLLKQMDKQIMLRIKDDGKGFKPSKQRSIKQVGLLSMKDSIAYLGGKFTITSEPGQGTVIEAKCPRIVYGVKSI